MKIDAKLILLAAAYCIPFMGYSQGFAPIDACGDRNSDPSSKVYFTKFYWHDENNSTSGDSSYSEKLDKIYEYPTDPVTGYIGNYIKIIESDDVVTQNGTNVSAIHVSDGPLINAADFPDYLKYSCGSYFRYHWSGGNASDDENILTSFLNGDDVSDTYGANTYLQVKETHTGVSYSVTLTTTMYDPDDGSIIGTHIVVESMSLDGEYTPSKQINDGKDKGTNNACTTRDSTKMPIWYVTEPYINLWIRDTPVYYTTSLGKRIGFEVIYKQRDTRPTDSAVTAVPITGWNHNWFSYVHFQVPTFVTSTNSNGFEVTGTSARGAKMRANWVVTNDFSQWDAILYAPDGGENSFNHSSHSETDSGLVLLPMDGADEHIYAGTENEASGPNVYGKVGFRLVHPDGSQDIYGSVTGIAPVWGMAKKGGRLAIAGSASDQITVNLPATEVNYWSTNSGTMFDNNSYRPPEQPIGYLAGEALLTERIDPYGNSIHLNYASGLLQSIVDYDGRTTTLSYSDGLLTQVDMPYARSAYFGYDTNRLLTSIVDAEKMTNFISYSQFSFREYLKYNVSVDSTVFYASQLSTLYGNTTFNHTEADHFITYSNPPFTKLIPHTWNKSTGTGSLTTNSLGTIPIYVGSAGGTNRINRACAITNPDGSRELYVYRYDSSSLVPSNYPPEEVPNGVSDDGRAPPGSSEAPRDAWLSTRNSFHWNRKQSEGVDLNNPSLGQLAVATMSHWLAAVDDENTASDTVSMVRAASPDGTRAGQKTWFDYSGKPAAWRASTDCASDIAYQIMPDGNVSSKATLYAKRLPTSVTETYTMPGGTIGTRSYSHNYDTFTATELCSDGSSVSWSYLMLMGISGPDWSYTLSNPEDVTTTRTSGSYTFTTTIPRRLQLVVTDPAGNSTTDYYNNRQQLTGISRANGLTKTNLFGSDGFLAKSIDIESKGTNSFSYANGVLQSSISPLGLNLSYSWDKLDRLTGTTFPDGTTISNKYDKLDVVANKDRLGNWSYANFDSMDQIYQSTDPRGNSIHYSWCLCGALGSITDPLNHYTIYARDNGGNVISASTDDGFSTIFNRNILGLVTNVTDSSGLDLKYSYNIQGLITKISSPTGTVFAAMYDIDDRPIQVTDAQGNSITNAFDALGRIANRWNSFGLMEQNTYSVQGISQRFDALYHLTSYGYDAAGRVSSIANPNQEVTQVAYDPVGDIVSLTDGRSYSKRWAYDIYGRQIAETNANHVLVKTNGYDANGRLTAQWTAAKGKSQMGYDLNGNLTSVVHPNTGTVTYSYDALNRLTGFSDPVGSSSLGYTSFGAFKGAMASEDGPWSSDTVIYGYADHKLTSIGLGSWTENISYDGASRPHVFSHSTDFYTNNFNGAGLQLASLQMPGGTVSYGHDPAGEVNLIQLKNGGNVLDSHGYAYDPTGLITTVTRMNGVTASYGYDQAGQLVAAQALEPDGAALRKNEDLGYAYDASQNLAYRTNHTLLQTFTSDPVNELATVVRSGTLTVMGSVTGAIAHLAVNGRPAEIYGDGSFASAEGFDFTNHLFITLATNAAGTLVGSTRTAATLPPTVNFSYDLNGNLTGDGLRLFNYDDENQLINVTVAGQWKSDFVYDGMGRRRITQDYAWQGGAWNITNEVRYVYDGMVVMQERDASGNVLVTYTRGLDLSGTRQGAGGIGGLLARTDGSGSTYYHSDAGGNITAMVDSSGNVVARYLYDPFGNLLAKSGPMADVNRYRFSSKELHPLSGLYYYGFRFYEPNLQRWLNHDPIGERGGLNLYGFVGNNPVNYVDPLGLTTVTSPDWFPGATDVNENGDFTRNVNDGSDATTALKRLTQEQLREEEQRTADRLKQFEKDQCKKDRRAEGSFDTKFFGCKGCYYYVDGMNRIYAYNEINYLGIGMYERWLGDSKLTADIITLVWKETQYPGDPIPSGTWYWLHRGYDDYQNMGSGLSGGSSGSSGGRR